MFKDTPIAMERRNAPLLNTDVSYFFFSSFFCPNAAMIGRREGHINSTSLTWHGMDEVPAKNKESGFGLQLVDGLHSLLS